MNISKRSALLLCSVSALTLPTAAFAQAAEEGTTDTREILVTATRDTRDLQDVAMQVNVVTAEDLTKMKIFDVKDISQLAPGLTLSNNDPRKNTTSLRGISFDPDQGTSPAVQVYYNEIPADAQTVYTAIYDIGQIEVLRGPQGLLRGLSAPAGSITIATKRPNFDEIEGYATMTATTRNGYNVQGGVSLPFNDKIAIRLAALVDGNRGNNVRNITRGGDYSRSRTESARATLGLRPNDDFTAYLTYQYLTSDINTYQQVVGAGNAPTRTYSELFGFPAIFVGSTFAPNPALRSGPALGVKDYASVTDGRYRVQLKSHIVNLAMDYDFGPAALSFVGAHQYSVVDTERDQDVGNAVPGYAQGSFVTVPYKVTTQELRLYSTNPEGFGWSVSAFHVKQSGDVVNDVNNDLFNYNTDPNGFVKSPLGPGGSFITVPNKLPLFVHVTVPVRTETTSIAANVHYFSGPLKIEAGIRYNMLRGRQTTQLQTIGFQNSGPNEIIPLALQRRHENPITGGANISYEITPDANIYLAYGRAYRAPTTGVSVPAGITNDLVRTTEEATDSFEGGIKGALFDRRVRFSLAAFYQKFNGYVSRFEGIFYDAPNNPGGRNGFFGFNYNGDAKVKGVEASLDGRITDNWDFGINAAYAHARYSNASLPCNDYAGTGSPNQTGAPRVTGTGNVSYCVSNGRISEVPDFSLTANTEIRVPMGDLTPFIRAQFSHRPGFFSERVQYAYQSRQLLNLFVGLRGPDDKWSVDLFARNLLNQRRITNISLGNAQITTIIPGGGVFDSGYRTVNATNPREFGITTSFKF